VSMSWILFYQENTRKVEPLSLPMDPHVSRIKHGSFGRMRKCELRGFHDMPNPLTLVTE